MLRRVRTISVLALLAAGAISLISAVQPWLVVTRADGAVDVAVPGADAVALLVPLSLAALALGAALALSGKLMRYLVGALALLIAVVMGMTTATLLRELPISAVLPTITDLTGLAGPAASALVAGILPTGWPWWSLLASLVLAATALLILATAHAWPRGGQRYRAARESSASTKDAVDSWDELSRGIDPTDRAID